MELIAVWVGGIWNRDVRRAFQRWQWELGSLGGLVILNLARNDLTSLPETLGQLTCLQRLCLGCNALNHLPDSTPAFIGLQRHCTCARSRVGVSSLCAARVQFYAGIGELKKLETLQAFSNKLTSLPASFGELCRLRDLNLASNLLRTLPSSAANLTQLLALNLSWNHLKDLPEEVPRQNRHPEPEYFVTVSNTTSAPTVWLLLFADWETQHAGVVKFVKKPPESASQQHRLDDLS